MEKEKDTAKQPALPRCPECGIEGTDEVVSHASGETSRDGTPWFFVAACRACGHIYGVFAKHVFGPRGAQLIVERK